MANYRSVYYHPQAWDADCGKEVARLYQADDGTVSVEIIQDADYGLNRQHRAVMMMGQEDMSEGQVEFEELPISVGPHFRLGPVLNLE